MAQAAIWDLYVMEFARSKDQPWVDLVAGMYPEGVMDLPFSFVLSQREGRNVLVDTGFMRDERGPVFPANSESQPGFRRCACYRR